MRDSFIFYSSFLEALDELAPEIQLEIYRAISHYALNGEIPELTGISKAVFALIKPQLDANNEKYENYKRDVENGKKGAEFGKLGGRPSHKKNQKTPVCTRGVSDEKPPLNPGGVFEKNPINVNDNVNVNVNDNNFPPISPRGEEKKVDCLELFSKVKQKYDKITGKNGFLSSEQIQTGLYPLYMETSDFFETIDHVCHIMSYLQAEWGKKLDFVPGLSWLFEIDKKRNKSNYATIRDGTYDEAFKKWRLDKLKTSNNNG